MSQVVVIGGGYGGVTVAKALDPYASVVLIEPKDAFQHNVAALRALVDAAWQERIFLPYDRLLARGTVRRDRAVQVSANEVLLASGVRLNPDIVVLATGSRYPFPAKADHVARAEAIARYGAMHANLAKADRVLLLGAGAVGLELAGEIASAWPAKQVTLVDPAEHILPGPYDQRLRDELNRQLDVLGVQRVLGSQLVGVPHAAAGELEPFTAQTATGTTVEADIWFRCYGATPVTDYLAGDLAAARRADGYIEVTPDLRLAGFPQVYALGDIAAIDMNKAGAAARQAEVVAANIRAQLTGSESTEYTPGPPAILLPLGPTGGAGQRANAEELFTAEQVAQIKGRDMMIDRFAQLLNADT
jgi:NADH dehydrogenase FAD-containing subunit